MERKEIFKIISKFEESCLTFLEIEEDSFKLKMEKPDKQAVAQDAALNVAQPAPQPKAKPAEPQLPEDNGFKKAKSPIVGVFYQSPAPGEPPFAVLGQKVEKGQVICLVEAMKMINELKSPIEGVVKAIHGVDGQLVEFDQVLFEVEPC